MTADRLLKKGLLGRVDMEQSTLKREYGYPPFSVLDTKDGRWQKRRRSWLKLGIKSEVGRGRGLFELVEAAKFQERHSKRRLAGKNCNPGKNSRMLEGEGSVVSVFDPFLCELIVRWFSPPGGVVLDPFAGGSVRGIVSSVLGRKYCGIELRRIQVEANREQLDENTTGRFPPKWKCGDSFDLVGKTPKADLLFSCPPYGDLEVYSGLPGDVSNMEYADFLERYREIISRSVERLRDDRFACFVVGNYRDKDGMYHDLVGDTVRAFADAGMGYYNEAVLLNAIGSAPVRSRTYFTNRKLVKLHQNVLIFVKGSFKGASSFCKGEEE
jgi:hypothetical protein